MKANIAQNAEDVQAMDNVNSDSEDEDDNAIKKVKFKKLVGSSPEV